MKTIKLFLLIAIVFFLATPVCAVGWDSPKYVSSEILIKFKPAAKKQMTKSTSNLCRKLNAKEIDRYSINDVVRMKLPAGASILGSVKEACKNPDVLYAEPNQYIYSTMVPNDEFWQLACWNMKKIKMSEAWDITTGSNKIIIAVLDTGIDYANPDLSRNIWVNQREIPYNKIDDDRNGYVDDYRGWDFTNYDSDPMDDNNHGTLCAGVIGAVGNNRIIIPGINWNVRLMSIKISDNKGHGTLASTLGAIQYAAQNGAKIINCSWVFFNYSRALRDAIEAGNKYGLLFVASAGNFGSNDDEKPLYPCCYNLPNIISVAASNTNDDLYSSQTWSSCYGPKTVHLAAPGWSVLSTAPGVLRFGRINGTSGAAAHVSGVCGLIWAQNPNWTNVQVKQKLLDSVDKVSPLKGKVMTGGRLNAYNAVKPAVAYTGPIIQYREAITSPDGKRKVFFDHAIPQQGTIEETVAVLKRMAAALRGQYLYGMQGGAVAGSPRPAVLPQPIKPAGKYNEVKDAYNKLLKTQKELEVKHAGIKSKLQGTERNYLQATEQLNAFKVQLEKDKVFLERAKTLPNNPPGYARDRSLPLHQAAVARSLVRVAEAKNRQEKIKKELEGLKKQLAELDTHIRDIGKQIEKLAQELVNLK